MIKLITIIMMFATSTYAADITVDMLNKRDDGAKMAYWQKPHTMYHIQT